jgi:hypothetical protein
MLWTNWAIFEYSDRLLEPYRRTFAEFGVHESYFQEARRRASDGRVDDALAMFRQASKVQPELHLDAVTSVDQMRLVAHGEERARAGDPAGAVDDFG